MLFLFSFLSTACGVQFKYMIQFPQPPLRETDLLWSRRVVCAVSGELADRTRAEGGE